MNKVKVGQVWGKKRDKKNNIAITKVDESGFDHCNYVYNDGETVNDDNMFFAKENRNLLAEYPTWQEAVNSKEFNNE